MKRLQLKPVFQMAVALMAAILVLYSCKKDPETPTGGNKILIGATMPDTVSYQFAKVSTQLNGTSGNQISQHGHCWSTESSPDIEDSHNSLGGISSPGKFTSDLSGLSDNTKYFVRSYVTFQGGTIYGIQNEIITLKRGKPVANTGVATDLTTSSVKMSGTATFDSGYAITQKGICWDTAANPNLLKSIGHSEEGAGKGSFTSSVANLIENKQYFYCAYATNEKGTAYGTVLSFHTGIIMQPVVTTSPYSNVTTTSATCGGNVTNAGNGTVSARGVCWNTTGNPTLANSLDHTTNGDGTGAFTSSINGLNEGTAYFVTAYATNEKGTSYGVILSFQTLSITQPTVTTSPCTDITTNSATCGGNVTNAGNGTVSARGVCWNTTGNPTLANSLDHTTNGNGTGTFTSSINGLNEGTIYFVTAYATNEKGTSYGDIKQFMTIKIEKPTVLTSNVTNITLITATGGGNVTIDGNATVTERGICWDISSNPTIANSHTTDGGGTGVFVSNLTGLTPNTLYYVRAYATNIVGTSYGNEVSFTTLNFAIGQSFGGGIIFYIDGTGSHGLISATSNQSSGAQWGCKATSISGTSTAIGTGQTNTTLIVNGCSTAGIAARICNDLVHNGYSDWFLPSKDELNQMYLQKTFIGGFSSGGYYWSSSEETAYSAWAQYFSTGGQLYYMKDTDGYVRAVRAF